MMGKKRSVNTHDYSKPAVNQYTRLIDIIDGGQQLRVLAHGWGVEKGDYIILLQHKGRAETTRYQVETVNYEIHGASGTWSGLLKFVPRNTQ